MRIRRQQHKRRRIETPEGMEDLGIFTVLLIGENPFSISIADNIKSRFRDIEGECETKTDFNIIEDMDAQSSSSKWFNEFVFELQSCSTKTTNLVLSKGFAEWAAGIDPSDLEYKYMVKMLKAMNTIIVDISESADTTQFEESIPQFKFKDGMFVDDLVRWIDDNIAKLKPHLPEIRLTQALCGTCIPFLGDAFGCLYGEGSKFGSIVKSDRFRFDTPILFDEFCHLMRGRSDEEIERCIVMRTNSALSVFFK